MTLEVLSGLLSCFSKASPCLVLAVPAFSAVSSVPECLSPYRPGAASGLVSSGKCRGQYQQRPVCFPNVTIILTLGLESGVIPWH